MDCEVIWDRIWKWSYWLENCICCEIFLIHNVSKNKINNKFSKLNCRRMGNSQIMESEKMSKFSSFRANLVKMVLFWLYHSVTIGFLRLIGSNLKKRIIHNMQEIWRGKKHTFFSIQNTITTVNWYFS